MLRITLNMVRGEKSLQSVTRIQNSEETSLQSTVTGLDSISRLPNEIPPLTQNDLESSELSAIVQSTGQVPTAPEQHGSMASTNEMWSRRGGGINCPMSNISVPEFALHFALSDYLTGAAYGTGLAEEYDAAPSTLGRSSDVDISVVTSFHKFSSQEKWEAEALHGDQDNDHSKFVILPGVCPDTGSEAATCAEIPPKILEIGSSTLENVCNFHGQGNLAQLDSLRDDETFESNDVTDRILNQPLPLHNTEPENPIHTINDLGAENTQNHVHYGETFELVSSEELVLATSRYPAYQLQLEDEIMIYNYHAQQWQDELMIFNYHEANAEGDLGPMSGICDVTPTLQEQPRLQVRDGVHSNTPSNVVTDGFSFWPAETSFDYSLKEHPSPSLWPGSRSAEQPPRSCYSNEASTSYTWQNADSSALDNIKPETAARKHDLEAEACGLLGNWLESRGDPLYSMSQRDNADDARDKHIAGSPKEHVDKRSNCPGVSAEQETTGMQQRVFADSLDLPQEDNNQFRNQAFAWLQEHASELLQCSKRDRTNSIEMLTRPTSSLRKKKQKDQEIPEGRLRGTSICTDADLSYGLAAVQNVIKDFHKSAGLILKAKLQKPRPPVTDLLDAELEALCIGDDLGPEVKVAVFAVLKRGRGNHQATTTDSSLVEMILDLKWRLASLMEESRAHERSSLSQLRDTVTRYSFLFPSSASDALTKRETPGKYYQELENLVCQFFGESKLFFKPSFASASSSSGRQGHEHSNDTGSVPSVHPIVRGHVSVQSLGEPNAGATSSVERSERTRISSRKDLSGARGNLPKVAADYMKQWLFENFQNPNPTRETKLFIATKFNITEKQVTNHFVNLRARKFRPLLRSLQEDPRSEVVDNMQDPNDEDIGSSESPGSAKGACCH